MGMDLYGKNPTSETGKYFRRNVWGWHPLAYYVTETFPNLTAECEHWHTNDGDGLEEQDSEELARQLRREVDSGRAAEYVTARNLILAAEPDEPCQWCNTTGVRRDKVGIDLGFAARAWCNGCNGKGTTRPFSNSYEVDVQDITEFADFLADCGGFEIC